MTCHEISAKEEIIQFTSKHRQRITSKPNHSLVTIQTSRSLTLAIHTIYKTMAVKTTKNTSQFQDLKKANLKAEPYKSAIYFVYNTNESLCDSKNFIF